MHLTKCNRCKKIIKNYSEKTIVELAYNIKDLPSRLDFCQKCSAKLVAFLKKYLKF